MYFRTAAALSAVAASLPSLAAAQVFAHVIVGNTNNYDINQWKSDIQLAASYGIEGFALNIAEPWNSDGAATQMSYAFQAANQLRGNIPVDFKMFFSFDYLGGPNGINGPWTTSDLVQIMKAYGPNGAYYQYNGKPFVSTFEGPQNSDLHQWNDVRNQVPGGIYLVPDWTSQGPNGFDHNLVDGAFSWDMWPDGPQNKTTDSDYAWKNALAPKTFMMGISPWFYTDLPSYGKAWVWRGDDMWYRRWQQALDVKPQQVEIVTWNDFGESHYIGPIYNAGVPSGSGTDAHAYVDGHPHTAWLETLPYQIAAYKHAIDGSKPAPNVASGQDKIVYWYRTSPASAGSTDATGNDCKSNINQGGYQQCYPIPQILEDAVFAIVLSSTNGNSATISIGGSSQTFGNLNKGINFISKPFNGATGTVKVNMGSISGSGAAITSQPANGKANFNPIVYCAGSCRQ